MREGGRILRSLAYFAEVFLATKTGQRVAQYILSKTLLGLRQKIERDAKEAMRQKDSLRLSVLRMLLSALHNRALEKRAKSGKEEDVSQDEAMAVLRMEAKKRKEAVGAFTAGGRRDLAEKETAELKILEEYMPPEISGADLKNIVKNTIVSLNATSAKDFGRVMKEVMKETKGQAAGDKISACVKELLADGK